MKSRFKEFVLSVYPAASVYQGVGARYTIMADKNSQSNNNDATKIIFLSDTKSTENSAWKDAAKNIRKKETKQ